MKVKFMNTIKLTSSDRKFLRGQAHELEPKVRVGKNGLTPAVLEELNKKLAEFGLLKIKVLATKESHDALLSSIAEKANCEIVGSVGSVVILFRVGVKPLSRMHLE